MTNGDYFRSCNDEDMAACLTSIVVSVVSQLGIEVTQSMINKETEGFLKYLKEEIVSEYLN